MAPDREMGPLGNEGTDMVMRIPIKQYIDDLMKEVREGFKDLREALASKADKSVVEDHGRRLNELERERPSREYGEQLLREHREMQASVETLKTGSATQAQLAEQRKEMMRPIWALVVTIVSGLVVGLALFFVTQHPHIP